MIHHCVWTVRTGCAQRDRTEGPDTSWFYPGWWWICSRT